MRELVNWWKERTSQFLVLCCFALLLAWQNLQVRRGDGYFRRIVAEVRESFRQQEATREIQFARLLHKVEVRLSRIDEALARTGSPRVPAPSPPPPASRPGTP